MGHPEPTDFNDSVQADLADLSLGRGDLQSMAQQLAIIADRLRDGAFSSVGTGRHRDNEDSRHSKGDLTKAVPGDHAFQRAINAKMARTDYALRRERDAIFSAPELFGEPAWDILLDLYVAHSDNNPVSVSSACIGSAAPPTTGLRWLGVLAEQGLIVREHDPSDQRRVLVRLSEKGLEKMDAYFAGASGVD